MKLTDRLLKIASLVDNGKRIADIGTDHGYIPVYLLNQNKIQYAILGDVNKGPLENARKEVTRNKLQDKVDLRLGSGIEVLKENEVDEIIIAGMGGMLINNLLKANEKVKAGELLLEFDKEAIQKAGYSLITPVVITNSFEFEQKQLCLDQEISYGKSIINLSAVNA